MTAANPTYRQLEEALRGLGFAQGETVENNRVFRHQQSGALIMYPELPADDPVLPRHLGMVRAVLATYGIADSTDLAAELQRAG